MTTEGELYGVKLGTVMPAVDGGRAWGSDVEFTICDDEESFAWPPRVGEIVSTIFLAIDGTNVAGRFVREGAAVKSAGAFVGTEDETFVPDGLWERPSETGRGTAVSSCLGLVEQELGTNVDFAIDDGTVWLPRVGEIVPLWLVALDGAKVGASTGRFVCEGETGKSTGAFVVGPEDGALAPGGFWNRPFGAAVELVGMGVPPLTNGALIGAKLDPTVLLVADGREVGTNVESVIVDGTVWPPRVGAIVPSRLLSIDGINVGVSTGLVVGRGATGRSTRAFVGGPDDDAFVPVGFWSPPSGAGVELVGLDVPLTNGALLGALGATVLSPAVNDRALGTNVFESAGIVEPPRVGAIVSPRLFAVDGANDEGKETGDGLGKVIGDVVLSAIGAAVTVELFVDPPRKFVGLELGANDDVLLERVEREPRFWSLGAIDGLVWFVLPPVCCFEGTNVGGALGDLLGGVIVVVALPDTTVPFDSDGWVEGMLDGLKLVVEEVLLDAPTDTAMGKVIFVGGLLGISVRSDGTLPGRAIGALLERWIGLLLSRWLGADVTVAFPPTAVLGKLGADAIVPLLSPVAGRSLGRWPGADVNVAFPPSTVVLGTLGAVVAVPLLSPVAGLSLGRRLGADVNVAFPPSKTVAETFGAVAVEPLLPAVAGLSLGLWLGAVAVLSFPPTTTIVTLLPPVAATTTTAVDDDDVADKNVDESMVNGPKLVGACVVWETVVVFEPGRAVGTKTA
jgi:hypothetical protein